MEGSIINRVNSIKYIGVIIDHKLNWIEHIVEEEEGVPMHPQWYIFLTYIFVFLRVSNKRILMFPLRNIVPWGPFGSHLGNHLGFPMKTDDQHNFWTRQHTATNDPIFLTNLGMRNRLRGVFSWYEQAGHIKIGKIGIFYAQNVAHLSTYPVLNTILDSHEVWNKLQLPVGIVSEKYL